MASLYAPRHEPTLRRALHRLGFWSDARRPLPEPGDVRRGVAGHSAVYLVYLPARAGGGRYLAAKFDQLARSGREWRAVEQLRTLDSPPEILLPLPGNTPADGVMVFQAAEAVAGHLPCVTLLQYLTQQIASNPENCRTALTGTFEVLGGYYDLEPGARRLDQGQRLLRWRDVYGDQLRPTAISRARAAAARHWPGVDWDAAPAFSLAGCGGADGRELPNPFLRLPQLLGEATGKVMVSRIHGDLNLSNVIVSQRHDGSAERVLVFDLANCKPNRVQAVDFARLEAEIWRRIYASPANQGTEDEFLAPRDVLDGRRAEVPENLSAATHGCVLAVDHLRVLAQARLAPRPPGTYLLADYMQALYFTSLSTLKHPDVAASRACSRVMLLSAALSLAFLDEVQRGLYAPGSLNSRWPPPRHLAEAARIESSGTPTAESLAPALPQPASRRPLAPPRLHQLPPPPRDFTGRIAEIDNLGRSLPSADAGQAILGIFGAGGIGKTALARQMGTEWATHYSDAQIVLDMQGLAAPLSVNEAMAFVIRSLLPEAELPDREQEMAALYRHVMHGKRILLLMDNAEGPDQVEPLFPGSGSLLLVTSRSQFSLPGLVPLRLGELPEADAKELLLRICPRIGDATASLVALCGGLPLALRVVGSTLADRSDLSPAAYARRVREGRAQLGPVDASLETSCQRLPPELRRLWQALAVFPSTFTLHAAAAVWRLDHDAAEDALGKLLVRSLIECPPGSSRYRLHDLARAFAGRCLSTADRSIAASRHAAFYLFLLHSATALYRTGGEARDLVGLAMFDSEWENIRAGQLWAASQPAEDLSAAHLCSQYSAESAYFLYMRLSPQERMRWHEAALAAARRTGDRASEGLHLGQLGIDYKDAAEPLKAIELLEQELEIARAGGDHDSECGALCNLGGVYMDLGKPERAFDLFTMALARARQDGRRLSEGIILHNLGKIYEQRGDLARALELYEQDLHIAREGGYTHHVAHSLISLGEVQRSMGETALARKHFEAALSIARAIGDRRTESSALTSLGITFRALGEPDPAVACFQDAAAIAQERGDLFAESWARWNLGLVYEEQGDFARAAELMQMKVDLERRTGHADADTDAASVEAIRAKLPTTSKD
jgi:tetratricopeptide (TPR) repeat protein